MQLCFALIELFHYLKLRTLDCIEFAFEALFLAECRIYLGMCRIKLGPVRMIE